MYSILQSQQLAGQYVTGYTANKQFTTPLQQLVAYNAGPTSLSNGSLAARMSGIYPTKRKHPPSCGVSAEFKEHDMAMMSMDVETDRHHNRWSGHRSPWNTTGASEALSFLTACAVFIHGSILLDATAANDVMDVDTNPNINIDGSQVDDNHWWQSRAAVGLPSAVNYPPSSYMAPQMQNGGGMSHRQGTSSHQRTCSL